MKHEDYEYLEAMMRRCRLSGQSPGLKDRILAAATKIWTQGQPDSAEWAKSLWRFVASIAAAILLVLAAGSGSDWALSRWQPDPGPVYVQVQSASGDLNVNDDLPWPRLARINVIVTPEDTLDQLLRYRQSMQRLFEEEMDRVPVRQEAPRQGSKDPMGPPAWTLS